MAFRAAGFLRRIFSRAALLYLGEDLAAFAHDHFPFGSVADDVRFINRLALALFTGDVLQLRPGQFPLDCVSSGRRDLIELHLEFTCLSTTLRLRPHSGTTASSYNSHHE